MGRNSGGVRGGSQKYTSTQIDKTLHDYVYGEALEINGWLRDHESYDISQENLENIKVLDAITKDKVPDVLWRTTEARSIFGRMSQAEYDELYMHVVEGKSSKTMQSRIDGVLNKTITDKAYMSTSKSRTIAENLDFSVRPIMLRINSKKGRGVDVGKHSVGEEEVILKRNTKYKVNKVYGSKGDIYVDVTII